MDGSVKKYDPTDDAGSLLGGYFECNIDIARYRALKKKYGLDRDANPFIELPRLGASPEEVDSMVLSYSW